jgi:nicotinamide-nucleotide amidase
MGWVRIRQVCTRPIVACHEPVSKYAGTTRPKATPMAARRRKTIPSVSFGSKAVTHFLWEGGHSPLGRRLWPMTQGSETLSPALPPDVEELALDVLNAAVEANWTLATAESCTGGLLASLLTDVEGCGHCFDRGFVTYTKEAKTELLGVPLDLLQREGAVSQATAQAMVCGALTRSHADFAVAITGYAGPGGADSIPGLVYIALARRGERAKIAEHHFGNGSRGDVRLRCLRAALELLHARLKRPT